MPATDQRGINLQVANTRPQDAGGGFARITQETMAAIGIREGQIVEIAGKRHTAAVAMRSYPEDRV